MAQAEITASEVEPSAPHTHRHGRVSDSRKRLSLVLALTAIYMIAETFGGWWTGSLALLADAGHMMTDVAALMLAAATFLFIRPRVRVLKHQMRNPYRGGLGRRVR